MGLKILTTQEADNDPEFSSGWQSIVQSCGDVYYDIDYLKTAEIMTEGRLLLSKFECADGAVIYPFILRPLEELPFWRGGDSARHDIVSPYEYGGALVCATERSQNGTLTNRYQEAFADYARSAGIVSEFVRFHPLLETQLYAHAHYETSFSCNNVVISLDGGGDKFFNEYSRSTRRNVRISERAGVSVSRCELTQENLGEFKRLYRVTMDRRQAHDRYMFSDEYFDSLSKLDESLISLYLASSPEGETIGAALFLHSETMAHYHLSGSTGARHRSLYAMNLLIHRAAGDFASAGKSWLHLGGAAPNQQTLLSFKEKYSSERRQYFVGSRILDLPSYTRLSDARETHRARNESFTDDDHSFPVYRRKY